MILPDNKRRDTTEISRRKLWIYGAPFSGKTFFANSFPDPLILNTDGNVSLIDAPVVAIKDIVTADGRITKRTLAWQVFKDVVVELEKKDNTFKTIIVDLVEDIYEHCRLYIFDREGYTHESDGGYGKGWSEVKTEFLTVMKRLTNLDYENIILISHEDGSDAVTKRTGEKITKIKPNIGDKLATKIAGMVDITARVVAEDDNRTLTFKQSEFVFGGGRITVGVKDIPLSYTAFDELYKATANKPKEQPVVVASKVEKTTIEDGTWTTNEDEHIDAPKEEKPVEEVKTSGIRVRRRRVSSNNDL